MFPFFYAEQIESKTKNENKMENNENKMEDNENKTERHIPVKPIPVKPSEFPRLSIRLRTDLMTDQNQPKTTKIDQTSPKSDSSPSEGAKNVSPKPKKVRKKKKKKAIQDVGYYDDLQIIKELSPKRKSITTKIKDGCSTSTFKSNAAEFIYDHLIRTQEKVKQSTVEKSDACFNITICPICKQTFWRSNEYTEHMKVYHQETTQSQGKF